jgi:hypothetical protein
MNLLGTLDRRTSFFAVGPFRGWPLRIWPIAKRPFIRLGERTYCFDLFGLFDNFYRVIQRLIFRLAPDYKQSWNVRQQAVSETLPLTYFARILPGARVFGPVYYRWKTGVGPAQWQEADGLITFEDHLFVIEVKAGAFTYTSPATDLPAHIVSLENLIRNPASQGTRFVDYLESADEVSVADRSHNEIARLRRRDFRHITICAVTLDAFTELAARAQHLRSIGVDIGSRPIWALSIDDLRVYSDVFDNPLLFLDFVEQRMRAAVSTDVDVNDELDHLGLYLTHNNYSMYAAGMLGSKAGKAALTFHGFRETIDKYYSALLHGDNPSAPRQSLPLRISELIEFLSRSRIGRRAEIASFVLGLDTGFRDQLSGHIGEQLDAAVRTGKVRPLSTHGDVRLTVFVWCSTTAPRNAEDALHHTRAILAAQNERGRHLLELTYSASGDLADVKWQHVTLSGIADGELAHLRMCGAEVRERRLLAARAAGKIGVNQPCPCGSGKKYKRCCRP